MFDDHWTRAEKKIARRVFETALQLELAELMAEFKARAERAESPDDMWQVVEFLSQSRRAIDSKYDYRYSRLSLVFGRLLGEKRIAEPELAGLSDDKLETIRHIASLAAVDQH